MVWFGSFFILASNFAAVSESPVARETDPVESSEERDDHPATEGWLYIFSEI